MQMLYNSDSYVVVRFDLPSGDVEAGEPGEPSEQASGRGGYEIVDKFARKEIFIQGVLAQSFQDGVKALIENDPTEEAMDAFIAPYCELMQTPLVMH